MKIPLTPLRCLRRAVELYGRKQAIVCGNLRFTYAEFGERCERLASALVRAGVQPGDRVGFLSFNTHRLLEGYYGAPLARAITMPLNVRLTPAELGSILRHAEARILFHEADFAPLVGHLKAVWPSMRTVSLDTEYEDFIAQGTPERPDILSYDEDAIAELFYTSGSTGTPKGVMLSHRTIYMHALAVAGQFNQDDNAVELHTIPLFHANGWGRPQTATMMGLKQVMVRRFEPATVCRLIQDEGATAMSLVPTMAGALLNFPDLGKYNLGSLRQIHIGGAAASPELIARMEQAFHCEVLAGYGLTETCPVASSSRRKGTVSYADEADRFRHQAMAGWPLPGTEIRVVDAHMQDVPRDMSSVGEVVICGDNVMDGYFREPEATAAVMSGPWFHTGDMAVWNDEGYIHIVDRKKDIIISGGENISSIEVEKAIAAHPGVLEAAVVGAPDPQWGEVPVAFVVAKPDVELTEEALHEFIVQRLAKFKLPRQYHFVAEPLPKGGTGKVLKRELREQFWQGKERRVQG
ncbi:MAG TPA: long-chain-fatty-acid--CoA ligase [Bryobacteraceae bacterium]|nr:long-chain-fatty-acid--CoA ligase [Bryobacteraceae bacterium]